MYDHWYCLSLLTLCSSRNLVRMSAVYLTDEPRRLPPLGDNLV